MRVQESRTKLKNLRESCSLWSTRVGMAAKYKALMYGMTFV